MGEAVASEVDRGTEAFWQRTKPFIETLPALQKSQFDALSLLAKRVLGMSCVIPNNLAFTFLLERVPFESRLDRLGAIHKQLNSMNIDLSEAAAHLVSHSEATPELLRIAQHWTSQAGLGNHFLGPRFAQAFFRIAAELNLSTAGLVSIAAGAMEGFDEDVMSSLKVSICIRAGQLLPFLGAILSLGQAGTVNLNRIEVQKEALGDTPRVALKIDIFTSAAELERVPFLLAEIQSHAVALIPSEVKYAVFPATDIAVSQGYSGLKTFLLLSNAIDRFYSRSNNYALRCGVDTRQIAPRQRPVTLVEQFADTD